MLTNEPVVAVVAVVVSVLTVLTVGVVNGVLVAVVAVETAAVVPVVGTGVLTVKIIVIASASRRRQKYSKFGLQIPLLLYCRSVRR